MVTRPPVVPPVYRPRAANAPAAQLSPKLTVPPVYRAQPQAPPRSEAQAPRPQAPPAYRPHASPVPARCGPQKGASAKGGSVQCAYFARRKLGGILGGVDTSENPHGLGIFHEHVFFEDGGTPKDLGFFDNEIHSDTQNKRQYWKLGGEFGGDFDDGFMRLAVSQNMDPGQYSLTGNNCQDWVKRVLASYNKIAERMGERTRTKTYTPHFEELGTI